MIARLFVREVGQREFVQHNGVWVDEDEQPADEAARKEGERLCVEGNVEAFEIFTRVCAFERQWALKAVE